jgi:hypothetical protein
LLYIGAIKNNLAGSRLHKAVYAPHQSRLARAGRPDNSYKFALMNGDRQALEYKGLAVIGFFKIAYL